MEFIVEDGRGSASFSVELGTDLSRHTLADLRSALGLRVAESHGSISLADIGLHRAMVFAGEAEQAVPSSAHLQAGWRPDREGRISVIRPPHGAAPRPERPSPPEHPQPLDPLPAIPYATVIPMLMVSALMATLWSPTFALLGAASAAIPLFRALGPRLTRTRAERRHAEEWREYELACRANEAAWGHAVAEWLERLVFSPGEIDRLVESVTLRPWTRRLATGVCLPVAVGRGGLVIPDGPAIGLDDVPLVVDIERGLAVTGDRAEVLALARWIGIETAYRHGPADLECTIITTPDRRADWEWARWLPGFATVEVEHAGANAVAARMAEAAATQLVIADGPTPSGPGAFARLLSGQMAAARVLWLGAVHDVPAVCEQVLEVTADGYVRSLDGAVAGWTWRLAANEAETFARFLAPFADPEVEERSAPLPDAVPLARLCPLGTGSTGEEELRASWDRARPDQLRIPLGMSSDGPLVVDVVCDGPHALVAGTTGSGKSELLRSLVLAAALQQSPDDLAFVLVDFKGGGAFDVVAPLPHVAALVTDLEPAHATRALRSLRAELKYREVVLRQHGASDLSMLERGTSPPRLMIVVDEFAALAEELPEFLDGLVDVARRGRSLGVHLVLATQRPAGVVTSEIRANTNLRICLRVREAADSVDVIDRPDAANLPPLPGRAIVTVGGEQHRLAQVGYLAGAELMTARPFTLEPSVGPTGATSWPSQIIDMIGRCHPERARAPWLPPLPPSIPAERLWVIGDASDRQRSTPGGRAVLGVLDDADRRLQLPIAWSPADGGVVVAAADPARLAATIATIVGSMALDAPDTEVLILDGSGGLVDRLGVLGSVADVVHHRDADRLSRALVVIDRRRRCGSSDGSPALVVVVNRWGPVVDTLSDVVGPDAPLHLARAFADGAIVPVIGVTSDRELPSRVLGSIRRRLVHRLGDASSGLALDVHHSNLPGPGAAVFDADAGLPGVVVDLSDHALARLAAWSKPTTLPEPVRVLAEQMPLDGLPVGSGDQQGWSVPIGFDEDLEPVTVRLAAGRRLIVLGRPGGGRTTTLATLVAGLDRLGAASDVEVIDDGDRLADDEVRRRLELADRAGRPVVVAASTSTARTFGGWLAPMLADATVLLLNPSRLDAEAVRLVVPDLSQHPTGRSILLDRGRATVLHVAMAEVA